MNLLSFDIAYVIETIEIVLGVIKLNFTIKLMS